MAVTYYGLNGLMTAANDSTGGALGWFTPIVLGIIFYGVLSQHGSSKAFATATFLAFISALPLYAFGITPVWLIVILAVLTALGVFMISRN